MKLKYFLWLHWLSPIGTCGNHNENEKTKQKKRSRNIYNVDVYLDHILLFCFFVCFCISVCLLGFVGTNIQISARCLILINLEISLFPTLWLCRLSVLFQFEAQWLRYFGVHNISFIRKANRIVSRIISQHTSIKLSLSIDVPFEYFT